MIPISTINNPTHRTPYLTYGLILVNILVFLWELTVPRTDLFSVFYNLSVVPCEITRHFFSLDTFASLVRSMFLHGGWAHLIGNMLFLWIFGSNVEDYYSRRYFLMVYIGTGVAAALTQTLINSGSCIPMVGASGAISGVLGSFLVLYPGVRVRVGVIFFRVFFKTFALPAYMILGYWFLLQVFYGIAALGPQTTATGGGVAFFAHIGGFVAGALIAFMFTMFVPPPRLVGMDD
jgi:membrane associated rhomboid family serine protease